ncbi:hypothetical protein GYB43_12845 [bacterium]|jgi:hypothetical protein|nr:hypothetical protein [bacterium]
MLLTRSSWCTRDLAALSSHSKRTDVALLDIVDKAGSKLLGASFEKPNRQILEAESKKQGGGEL